MLILQYELKIENCIVFLLLNIFMFAVKYVWD